MVPIAITKPRITIEKNALFLNHVITVLRAPAPVKVTKKVELWVIKLYGGDGLVSEIRVTEDGAWHGDGGGGYASSDLKGMLEASLGR